MDEIYVCFRRMNLKLMWWQLIIDCPHKSFDNCYNQELTFKLVEKKSHKRSIFSKDDSRDSVGVEISSHELTYRLTMCSPELYSSKLDIIIYHIQEIINFMIAISLEFFSLFTRKINPNYYSF